MPTKEQLSIIWESQFEYFGGSGQPMQTYGGNFDENGLTTVKHTDIPLTSYNKDSEFEGDEIGIITYDSDNQDLKVVVCTSSSTH